MYIDFDIWLDNNVKHRYSALSGNLHFNGNHLWYPMNCYFWGHKLLMKGNDITNWENLEFPIVMKGFFRNKKFSLGLEHFQE